MPAIGPIDESGDLRARGRLLGLLNDDQPMPRPAPLVMLPQSQGADAPPGA